MNTDKYKIIEERMANQRRFLDYIRINALLHDADKLTKDFLLWSKNRSSAPEYYPGHNSDGPGRRKYLTDQMNDVIPYHPDLNIPFPCDRAAVYPETLPKDIRLCVIINYCKTQKQKVINTLEKHNGLAEPETKGKINATETIKKVQKIAEDKQALLSPDELVFLSENIDDLKLQLASKTVEWIQISRPGVSLCDFYCWHHEFNAAIKTQTNIPTALQIFSAGTANIDGLDTRYETDTAVENEKKNMQHHAPEWDAGKFLIATPFGYERPETLDCARKIAEEEKLNEKLLKFHEFLKNGYKSNYTDDMAALEKSLQRAFEQSLIRTGRPVNDVTLADHSLSTAALAGAHAARIILETHGGGAGQTDRAYALPVRAGKRDEKSSWPITQFAIFSCAVNTGRLDAMAMTLKDITAIRAQVSRLFDRFERLLTLEWPAAGSVYRDQHGIHLVVPVLGDPGCRWIKADAAVQSFCINDSIPAVDWLSDTAGITNDDFQNWLFDTAQGAIKNVSLDFDRELLIGLRYQDIGDELNQLAQAIGWSRTISSCGAKPSGDAIDSNNIRVRFFHYSSHLENTRQSGAPASRPSDLCGVCGLRFRSRPKGKCEICHHREENARNPEPGKFIKDRREMGDIEKIASADPAGRVALLSVAFNMNTWLSEASNTGIYCYQSNTKEPFDKTNDNQRANSFGRLRSIWRSTQIFLEESREAIRGIIGAPEHGPTPMRTILLQPQDLQVFLPACRVKSVLDAIVKKFYQEFGRVPGRVPFNITALVFPFRVPIYIALAGLRRCLSLALSAPDNFTAVTLKKENGAFRVKRKTGGGLLTKSFSCPFPLDYTLEHTPSGCNMKGDHFYANIGRKTTDCGKNNVKWTFAGDWPADNEKHSAEACMVDNRLCLAEIRGGLCLNELGRPSADLPASHCHDFPLEYWYALSRLMELKSRISSSQQRSLVATLSRWEQMEFKKTAGDDRLNRAAIEMLWRDPGRLGSKAWNNLSPADQELLIDACENGAVYIANFISTSLQSAETERKTATQEKGYDRHHE